MRWLTGVGRHCVGAEAKFSGDAKGGLARQLDTYRLLKAFHRGKMSFSPSPPFLLILGLWG